jgi:hypothetical protein
VQKIRRLFVITLSLTFMFIQLGVSFAAQEPAASALDIRLVTDEADAVMLILQKLKSGQPVADTDWEHLFSSEGYVRLKKRELSLKRPFEDEDFRRSVLSAELAARTDALAGTLEHWKRADLSAAAARALAYLPSGTAIRAKVYPVIKPKTNSFVFELEIDPAIFLYLNPDMNSSQFENTVAHELHHIGLAAACLPVYDAEEFKKKPAEVRTVLEWIGGVGEAAAKQSSQTGEVLAVWSPELLKRLD